jgi:hypothetical protein
MKNWDGVTKLSKKRGRYGASKLKGFSVLEELEQKEYLSVRQLCLCTGIGYYSLARALPNWVRWEYVSRVPTTGIGEGDYAYGVLEKGRAWQKLAVAQLPNAQVFLEELNKWQLQVMTPEAYQKMRKLKFKDFISALDRMIKNFRDNK